MIETDETREAAARVGRTLRDKWHLDALIDVGGMAAVYAATHRNGLRGAVKILHRTQSSDPNIAARFRREGYIANKVDHPNSVSVLDDDVDDGNVFLVMELLEGSTLRERADATGGKLSADEVLAAADKVLDVLAVAHDASIVHRDIKPDNIFVTTDGHVKVLDFGIAGLTEATVHDRSATLSGLPMGTPAFMSPEQARGRWELVGPQSDLWSVGATMFLLLTGRQVHEEETVFELLSTIFTKPAPSLATMVPDCPPELADIVDRALQLHLADRWPDARTMQAAVRSVHRKLYGASLPPMTLEPRPGHQSVRRPVARVSSRNEATRVARSAGARIMGRLALASAFLLAGGLGIAEAKRRTPPPSDPPSSMAAAAIPAELVVAPPVFGAEEIPTFQPTTSSNDNLDAGTVATPSVPRRNLPASSVPIPRPRRPSLYDRRY